MRNVFLISKDVFIGICINSEICVFLVWVFNVRIWFFCLYCDIVLILKIFFFLRYLYVVGCLDGIKKKRGFKYL